MDGNGLILNGIRCKPLRATCKHSSYSVNGILLETYEEYVIAQLLFAMQIPFFHHLQIAFPSTGTSAQNVLWCPDFIFTQPYRWVGPECNGSVIIGIEVKRRHIKGKPMKKSRALCDLHGVPIIIINGDHLEAYQRNGRLPLKHLAAAS